MSPDAALFLDARDSKQHDGAGTIYFFKSDQFACWDVGQDCLLPGYPRDIENDWPGLLKLFPESKLRGALHVPEWGRKIYFFFDRQPESIVWDIAQNAVDAQTINSRALLPTALPDDDLTVVYAQRPDGQSVIYGFQGRDYTRWTVRGKLPIQEDPGFPRTIAIDWKDGLVLAPRSGVYVNWPNRSAAHSNRKIYFFMGDLYLRWDVPSNTRNYRLDILAGWKGWPRFSDDGVTRPTAEATPK